MSPFRRAERRHGVSAYTLCIALLAIVLVSLPVTASAQQKKGSKVHKLRGKLGDVRAKKNRVRAQIRATRVAASEVRVDIHRVDERIDRLQSDLVDTDRELTVEKERQAKGAILLAQTQRQLGATRQQVAARLRAIYLAGDAHLLSVLAGSRSVGDLVSRKEVMTAIAEKDRELFNRCVALNREVAVRKQAQDQTVVNVRRLKSHQIASKEALAQVREEKGIALRGLKKQHAVLEASLKAFEDDENEIASEIASYIRQTASRPRVGVPTHAGFFGRPCNGRISSGFGMRYHPILHIVRMHTGVDFAGPVGTPIYSVAEGVVIATGYGSGYGNRVIVDHGGGIITLYGHCSKIYVGSGQHVTRGQRIAAIGNTGLSTGPHLHFEVWENGRKVNPMSRL